MFTWQPCGQRVVSRLPISAVQIVPTGSAFLPHCTNGPGQRQLVRLPAEVDIRNGYQLDGENKLILIDLINKKILTKINFKKSKEWKIE